MDGLFYLQNMSEITREQSKRYINQLLRDPLKEDQMQRAMLSALYYSRDYIEENKDYYYNASLYLKRRIVATTKNAELYWETVKFEAHYWFESYMFYMEKNRPRNKQFYYPRRKQLRQVVQELQNLEDGKYDFLGISMPPRTGKSTVCIFFMTWVMGRRPNSHNAMSGHSGILADGFYGEAINLISSEEYTFREIFPESKIQRTYAEKKEVNLDKPDRFSTLTCRGIDGTWTGAVDISSDGYLYVDDLVRDRMESLSPTRLEKRYQDYLNVLVDRKNDGSKELMVGTRWNVLDPLGKVEQKFKNNPRYRFLKVPALNSAGESNFDYEYGVGFSTKYYVDMRERLDANEWQAKYQQRPFVREGLLFPPDELQYYNGVLPDGDSRVVSACDIAWGGGDSLSMPIGREYENGMVYVFDWVFNKGKKETTLPLVTGKIVGNEIRQICFEGNVGGDLYSQYVDERLRDKGYKCSCTSRKAPTTMAKMEKIIAYSGDIKRKYVFLDEEHRTQEYQDAMDELCMTVSIGKNEHDDAADGLTQLEMFVEGGNTKPTAILQSPF